MINKPFHEVLNSGTGAPKNTDLASARYRGPGPSARLHMLAEKFILVLETLISRTYPDGSPTAVSTSRHLPVKLPSESGK